MLYFGIMRTLGPDAHYTHLNEKYFSATSNACPMIAGVIALMRQVDNSLDVYDFTRMDDFATSPNYFAQTGDPEGYAPGDCTAPNEGFYSIQEAYWSEMPHDRDYFFGPYVEDPKGNNEEYDDCPVGWGIIDVYELYLFVLSLL